jgi:hypothetical protein
VLLRGNNSSNNKNQITFIAEGVETGLSVRDAVKNDTIATLGKSNFANIDPESIGQKVIFCLDNDGSKSFTDGVIHKAAERLISHGKEVLISIPNQINHTKTDFNDTARAEGIGTIRKNIDDAISYKQFSEQFKIEKNISNDFADKIKSVPKFAKQPDTTEKQKTNIFSSDRSFKNVECVDQPASKHEPLQINKSTQKTLDLEMSI